MREQNSKEDTIHESFQDPSIKLSATNAVEFADHLTLHARAYDPIKLVAQPGFLALLIISVHGRRLIPVKRGGVHGSKISSTRSGFTRRPHAAHSAVAGDRGMA